MNMINVEYVEAFGHGYSVVYFPFFVEEAVREGGEKTGCGAEDDEAFGEVLVSDKAGTSISERWH